MSNLNRLVLPAVLASTLLAGVGCHRVPTVTPSPSASAPASPPAAPPVTEPPPVTPPVTPPVAPTAAPTEPPPPPVTPPVAPPPTAAPTPAPVNSPPPASPPPAANPDVDKFWDQLGKAGFTDKAAISAELIKTVNLKITGWSKGKAETPDANVEQMFALTKAMFAKPPADPKEYAGRSMAFATAPFDSCVLLVDLKASTEHKNIYALRYDPNSKQIVGINEKDLEYNPGISAQAVVRSYADIEGKIFFYAEETGKFLDPARFVPVPAAILAPPKQGVQTMSVPRYAYPAPVVYRR